MEINKKEFDTKGIKFSVVKDDKEIGRAFLFILRNDFRNREYGFLEDVFVDENHRGGGIATEILKEIFKFAEEKKLYKIIATSRHGREKVHALYEKLGFKKFGIEFKMYLSPHLD